MGEQLGGSVRRKKCGQVVIQGTQSGVVCSCNCGEYAYVNWSAEAEAWIEKHTPTARTDRGQS